LGQEYDKAVQNYNTKLKRWQRLAPRAAQEYAPWTDADIAKDIGYKWEDYKVQMSQSEKQSTYTNQNDAMQERIDMLKSGSYKSRMHQPSVSKEE
jgi:hypothetical protein